MTQGVARFRTSFTFMAGNVSALIVEGKVVGLNMVNWTVNVAASYDRKRYYDIQVGSGYLHYNNGEGMSMFPEIGAKCYVCIPSDSTAPFVLSFVMPPENVDLATDDAPQGITSQSSSNRTSSGASFAGGRPKVKPGDIWIRTRDDNFLILHRGGVLQIGATELAQRLYIPLNNFIMDISDNYIHHNQAGSQAWGIQPVLNQDDYPAEHFQTFRIFAGDKYATVRLRSSKVDDPAKGVLDGDSNLGQVVYELDIAPQGFDVETGTIKDVKLLKMRFAFDAAGNVHLGGTGQFTQFFKKSILFKSEQSIGFNAGDLLTMQAKNGAVIDGGAFSHVKGGIVKLGPGGKPVAHQGSLVQVSFPYTPVGVPGSPPLVLFGTVITGEPTVLT